MQTNAFWENNLYKTGVHKPQAGAPGLIMTEVIIIILIMYIVNMTKIIKLTMIHIHNTNIISEIVKRRTASIQVLQSNSSDLLPSILVQIFEGHKFRCFHGNVWSTKIWSSKIYIL